MNQEQEEARVKINSIIKKYGIKAIKICELTGVEPSCFCLFRKGKKYLCKSELKAVELYLEQFKAVL